VDEGKEAWYSWRLFRKKPHIPNVGITYDGMRDAANAAHNAAGIRMHAATHAGRKDAPGQMVKCFGTSEAQVSLAGGVSMWRGSTTSGPSPLIHLLTVLASARPLCTSLQEV
jgi:hypothetical protein